MLQERSKKHDKKCARNVVVDRKQSVADGDVPKCTRKNVKPISSSKIRKNSLERLRESPGDYINRGRRYGEAQEAMCYMLQDIPECLALKNNFGETVPEAISIGVIVKLSQTVLQRVSPR